jgi:hypothetical protein
MESGPKIGVEPNISTDGLTIVGLTEDYRGGFEGFTLHNPIFSVPANSDYVYAKFGARWPYDAKKSTNQDPKYTNSPEAVMQSGLGKFARADVIDQGGLFFDPKDLNLLPNDVNIKPHQAIATYTDEFLAALEGIGFKDVQFDFNVNGYMLSVLDKERFEELSLEYGKRAMELLGVELKSLGFGQVSDTMSNSARVLLEDSGLVSPEKWILYNLFALHAHDLQTAVKYLSGNRIFLQRNLDEVVELLISRYQQLKPDEKDDLEKFKEFIGEAAAEVVKRDRLIEERLSKFQKK